MTPTPILYDPDCGFCRVSLAVVLRWDRHGRLRPVALGSEEADALLHAMPEDERMASWHLVEPGTRALRPVRAFSPLFRAPAGRAPARAAHAPASRAPPSAPTAWWRTIARCLGRLLPAAARRWADRVISGSRPR